MAFDGVYEPDPDPVCAVVGCKEQGRPHGCFYDGAMHGHGRIHYGCGYPESALAFRKGWHFVCNTHYRQLLAERQEWERGRTNA